MISEKVAYKKRHNNGYGNKSLYSTQTFYRILEMIQSNFDMYIQAAIFIKNIARTGTKDILNILQPREDERARSVTVSDKCEKYCITKKRTESC